jgi:hypothetical protein
MLLYVDDDDHDLIQRIQALIKRLPEPIEAIVVSIEDRFMQEQIELLRELDILPIKFPVNRLTEYFNCKVPEFKSIDDSYISSRKSFNKTSSYVDKRRSLMRGNGRMR